MMSAICSLLPPPDWVFIDFAFSAIASRIAWKWSQAKVFRAISKQPSDPALLSDGLCPESHSASFKQACDFDWPARAMGKDLEIITQEPDSEWLGHKKGLNTKIRLAVDAKGRLTRMLMAEGTKSDCKVSYPYYP